MKLVVLCGLPGVGKLSVASELSAMTGYGLFHNHLVMDLALSRFSFGSPSFVEFRDDVWLGVLKRCANEGVPGLVFTLPFDKTLKADFPQMLIEAVGGNAKDVSFVHLICDKEEHYKRLGAASRLAFSKIHSVNHYEECLARNEFAPLKLPAGALELNITDIPPQKAGRLIAQRLGLALNVQVSP